MNKHIPLNQWAHIAVDGYSALADHLGCDPAELEGLDLVKLVETLQAVEKWWIGDSTESFSGPVGNEQMMQEYAGLIQQIRQAVAQLPERKT